MFMFFYNSLLEMVHPCCCLQRGGFYDILLMKNSYYCPLLPPPRWGKCHVKMSPAEIDEIFKNRKGGSEKGGRGEWGALCTPHVGAITADP